MSLASTGEIVDEIEAIMAPRLDKAADYLTYRLRAALPKRSGRTAANTSWIRGRDPMTRIVRIPWPWQYSEFGTVQQKPRPIGRRVLLDSKDDIQRILNGEL